MPRIMSHNYEISDSDREFINDKISRLRKFYDRIQDVNVILDAARHTHLAEIMLLGPRLNVHVKSEAEDMRAAFEAAMNKAERNVKKTKGKLYGNKKHGRQSVSIRRFRDEEVLPLPAGVQDEKAVGVATLPREHIEPAVMSIDEARKRMAEEGKALLVFVNDETDAINILHCNKDKQVEWVEIG
jgi:putative sigma-54 modulation protein